MSPRSVSRLYKRVIASTSALSFMAAACGGAMGTAPSDADSAVSADAPASGVSGAALPSTASSSTTSASADRQAMGGTAAPSSVAAMSGKLYGPGQQPGLLRL